VEKKQFIEVDEFYLNNSGATVYFVKTPQTFIPEYFSKQFGVFFEAELLDKKETYTKEMVNFIKST